MSVSENLTSLKTGITKAAKECGRQAGDVQLVAVSKRQPNDRIEAALKSGHTLFGENRVQEATERWTNKKDQYTDLKLHLIGPLQTNKVADAVSLFDVIETIDRPKLATALSKEMKKQDKNCPCLIQVNTGEEEQKSGVKPQELENLLRHCRAENLDIRGLMCIPPIEEPAGVHFAFLKTLADHFGLRDLSMGMSVDYKQAIAAGATYIRVGSSLFGERQ